MLTTATRIRALSRAEVSTQRPVSLRGVVMVLDEAHRALYLHDGSAGVLVGHVQAIGAFRPGDFERE